MIRLIKVIPCMVNKVMKYFAIHAIVLCVVFTEVFSKDNPRTSVREFLRYTISCNLASSIVLLHYLYSKAIVFNILHRRADKKTIPKAKGYEHIISLFCIKTSLIVADRFSSSPTFCHKMSLSYQIVCR